MRSIALILLALLPIDAALADVTDTKITGGAVLMRIPMRRMPMLCERRGM
jgi:hypothetical protein